MVGICTSLGLQIRAFPRIEDFIMTVWEGVEGRKRGFLRTVDRLPGWRERWERLVWVLLLE